MRFFGKHRKDTDEASESEASNALHAAEDAVAEVDDAALPEVAAAEASSVAEESPETTRPFRVIPELLDDEEAERSIADEADAAFADTDDDELFDEELDDLLDDVDDFDDDFDDDDDDDDVVLHAKHSAAAVAATAAVAGDDEDEVGDEPSDEPGSEGEAGEKPKKEKKERKPLTKQAKKRIGITCAGIVAALAVVYGGGCLYFSGHMWPNTTFDGQDISMLDKEQTIAKLDEMASQYQLTIDGKEFTTEVNPADIGFSYDSAAATDDMFEARTVPAWPAEIFKEHSYEQIQRGSVDENRLADLLAPQIEEHNKEAERTVDAHFGYNKETGDVEIIPESYGTYLMSNAVVAEASMAARSLQHTATLDDDDVEQPSVVSTDAILVDNLERANEITQAKVDLKAAGKTVKTIDRNLLARWLIFEDGRVILDKDRVTKWAKSFADKNSTLHRERHYTRADGREITAQAGYYGWEIDADELGKQLQEKIDENKPGELDIPCTSEGVVFPDENGRDWGKRYMDVDLGEQYARFYGDDGNIIWESGIVSGAADGIHNTPEGVWFIEKKESPSTLIGWEYGKKIYETVVEYWMPFVDNGVGFHDATWQPDWVFGTDGYIIGYGSHGCVNLPYYAAEELYSIIEVNDVVVTHY